LDAIIAWQAENNLKAGGAPLTGGHRFLHNHTEYRLSILFLLWRVDAVSLGIHRKAV